MESAAMSAMTASKIKFFFIMTSESSNQNSVELAEATCANGIAKRVQRDLHTELDLRRRLRETPVTAIHSCRMRRRRDLRGCSMTKLNRRARPVQGRAPQSRISASRSRE